MISKRFHFGLTSVSLFVQIYFALNIVAQGAIAKVQLNSIILQVALRLNSMQKNVFFT